MSSVFINSSRTTQTLVGVGSFIAVAATSIYLIHGTRRRRRKRRQQLRSGRKYNGDGKEMIISDTETETEDDNVEMDFYKQFGVSEENLPSHIQREIYKERQRKSKVELISMKTRMYDNIFMLDMNGNEMCTISMKKARWYVKKGIAEWSHREEAGGDVNDDGDDRHRPDNTTDEDKESKCIRLLFEHNGKSSDNDYSKIYLRNAKQNICVSCGDDGYHIRHYIVPYSYRTLLPPEYKSHMSHDIVIFCPDCHLECERHSKRRMKQLERDLRMKMGASDVSPVVDDPALGHVRSCAIALVKWRETMPSEKVESYENVVREYLASVSDDDDEREAILLSNKGEQREGLSKSQLQKACSVSYRVKNPDYVPGSEIVVRSLGGDARVIEQFIVDWREHFISTVGPRYMPVGWKIDNPVVCGKGKNDSDDSHGDVKSW